MAAETTVSPAGLLILIWHLLKLTVLALLGFECCARTGRGLLRLLGFRPASSLETLGFSFLAGFPPLGLLLLGLALTGLFFPAIIIACCILLFTGARGFAPNRPLLVPAAGELRGTGRTGPLPLALLVLPLAYYFLTPAVHIDSYIYHLAMPWHCLMTHRMALNLVPNTFHLPLPVDIVFALPLLIGDDRLVVWFGMSCFAAASAIFAGRCIRLGASSSVWLGPLLALGSGYALFLLRYSKNDIAAAALFVAAALAYRSGASLGGAAFLGMCVAAKPVYAPLVLCWLALHRPSLRRMPVTAVAAGIWLAPWLLKSYIATGNPVFPFASSFFHSPFWEDTNNLLVAALTKAFLHQDTYSLAGLIPAWIKHMRTDYLLLLLATPYLLLLSGWRRAATACVLGQIAILYFGHHTRYVLPSAWLLLFIMASELQRLPLRWRGIVSVLLVGFTLSGALMKEEAFDRDWRDLLLTGQALKRKRLTTYHDTIQVLEELKAERLLSVGERRTYRLPRRVIYAGTRAEIPVIWKIAKESDGVRRVRIKFRQLGCGYMIYNYVSAEWLAQLYLPFRWTERMLGIYKEFCKSHLVAMTHNGYSDFSNGGFYIYAIRGRALDSPPKTLWFLPGTEGLYGMTIALENMGRKRQSLDTALQAFEQIPDVGHAWNQIGHCYTQLNESENAFRYLKPYYDEGMMDQLNIPETGAIAVRIGRLDLAESILKDCEWRYPDQIDTIYVNQALLCGQRAYRALLQKDMETAGGLLDKGEALLARVPEENIGDTLAVARRSTDAALTGLRADAFVMSGEKRKAAEYFRRAALLNPKSPQFARWRDLAARLSPRTIAIQGEARQ